jgi:hypothetical protein
MQGMGRRLRLVPVSEGDCFIAAMLTAASVLEGIHKDNPSNEEKKIWSAANAPVINQVRRKMASIIFTILKDGLEAVHQQSPETPFREQCYPDFAFGLMLEAKQGTLNMTH